MFSLLLTLTALPAHAEDQPPSGRPPMQLGLRYRALSVPDGVIDAWAYDEDDPDEPAPVERPKVHASAIGLEYSLVPPDSRWTFYVERLNNGTAAGYWDDVDDGEVDHLDGEWIAPSENFGLWTVGVNTGRDFALTDAAKPTWLALGLSGGLGISFVTGELTRWRVGYDYATEEVQDVDCLPTSPAFERYATCGDDGQVRIPSVVPMIDGNLGLIVNFPYGYIRLEGGLHDMLYWGVAGGGRF